MSSRLEKTDSAELCEKLVVCPKKIFDLGRMARLKRTLNALYAEPDANKVNYTYFLVDSRDWSPDMSFESFITTIFYAGRGVDYRFLSHFSEAQEFNRANPGAFDGIAEPKLTKITEIWRSSPVFVLVLEHGHFAEKTDALESAIITTLWSTNLVNKKIDGVASIPVGFDIQDVKDLGKSILLEFYEKRMEHIPIYSDDDFEEEIRSGLL